jgi:hypothetical protein
MISKKVATQLVYGIIQPWYPGEILSPTDTFESYGMPSEQIQDLADQLNKKLRDPGIEPDESSSWTTIGEAIATVMTKTLA